ncbi:MAG: hypothetical protein ACFFBD_06055, partial [Candidatus Hodarchaeota archaeon]
MPIGEIINSILLSIIPFIVAVLPYLLMKYRLHSLNVLYNINSLYKGIYFRLMAGFIAVYVFYYLIPAGIYFSGRFLLGEPNLLGPVDNVQIFDFPFYLFWFISQGFLNTFVFNFFFYIFPLIFGFSTVFAFFLLLVLLRREEGGTLREKLRLLTLSQETNPVDIITENLLRPDWSKQKDLLKVILAILPISLLLITSILEFLRQVEDPIKTVETGFGWFTDSFFVYLASIILCVQLLYSSRIYFHGIFVGERLRNEMVRSVSTVGGFLSLTMLLFSFLREPGTIPATLFFLSYLIMSSILLVLFLDIFEPLSIFILSKLIHYSSNLDFSKIKSLFTLGMIKNIVLITIITIIVNILGYGLFYGYILVAGDAYVALTRIGPTDTLLLSDLLLSYLAVTTSTTIQILLYLFLAATVPLLRRSFNSKNLFLNAGLVYLITLIGSLFSNILNVFFGYVSYAELFPEIEPLLPPLPINPLFLDTRSLFIATTLEEVNWWMTSFFAQFNVGNSYVYMPRLTPLSIAGSADVLISLRLAAIPTVLFFPFFQILFVGLFLAFFGAKFRGYSMPGEKIVERKIFASSPLPSLEEIQSNSSSFLLALNEAEKAQMTAEKDSLASILFEILEESPALVSEIKEEIEELEFEVLYKELVKLTAEDDEIEPLVLIYSQEYAYTYEEAVLDSLHVMMTDGRAVYSNDFQEESEVDPVLIAGLFAAITSFSREATRSEQFLRTIDHGDVVLIIEYGQWCFAAVIADRLTAVHRSKLRSFLDT